MIPGKLVKGMGGAMDLVTGARRVVVVMTHASRRGDLKLLERCEFPLTGTNCVNRVITDLGVFDPSGDHFRLVELAPGVTREQAQLQTGAPLR